MPASIELVIKRRGAEQWSVTNGDHTTLCVDLADLIYIVEKNLTIELQLLRPDLFFLHAAALASEDSCVVIAGASGAGKSTLCWELCNSGFQYMSDELAPIDPGTMEVEPYPHAICVKRAAEGMTSLPDETLSAGVTMHVPAEVVPSGAVTAKRKLQGMIFLDHLTERSESGITAIPTAEAAARIYSNGLNQLAHDEDGLSAATKLAAGVACYLLPRGELGFMRDEVVSLLEI
jgi:hypothetical protein